MSGIIEMEALAKNYGKHRGIEDVTLSIGEGEIFGFIGPNGAGKSTTIRCLLALIHPTSGRASIFGKDCIRDAPAIAAEIGYLPSEVFYYDHMRVKDLLNFSASFYHRDCSTRIRELCDRMELDPTRKIDELSYGNRKKVGIVQGLLHSPRVIFLDEPTSGLDPLMQNRFFELIREENQKGTTIFFSSHILSEVQKLCDRVGLIKDGRILRVESMASLKKESYKKVTLETEQPVAASALHLDGIAQAETDGGRTTFLYRGEVKALAGLLGSLPLLDFQVEEPDLEEIFLHYYQD